MTILNTYLLGVATALMTHFIMIYSYRYIGEETISGKKYRTYRLNLSYEQSMTKSLLPNSWPRLIMHLALIVCLSWIAVGASVLMTLGNMIVMTLDHRNRHRQVA